MRNLVFFLAALAGLQSYSYGAPLPVLRENEKGLILNPLGQKALSLRNAIYRSTKRLVETEKDPETFDLYKSRLEAMYPAGIFKANREFLSPEILAALREPQVGRVKPDADVLKDRVLLKYKLIDPRILKRLISKNGLVDIFIPSTLYNAPDTYNISIKYQPTMAPLLIESGLSVKAAVNRYIKDLQGAGYWVQLHQVSGGDAKNMKAQLVADQAWGVVGAVMIGTLPTAWYRNASDFDGVPSEFPMDLYFMDLDGNWGDANSDGKFDSHSGDVEPEIWVGRIGGNVPLTGKSEGQIIAEYLSRNHFYRVKNTSKFPQRLFSHNSDGSLHYRALAFQDDDWSGQANSQYLSGVTFNERVLVNTSVPTNATNYSNMIKAVPGGYFFLHLMAHSNPLGHSFKTGGGWSGGSINVTQLNDQLRRAHFYNLFNCSGTKYTVPNFLGGTYVYAQDYGLGAVGSAKTGAMLNFDVYYAHLAGALRADQADLADDWDVSVGKKATVGTAFLKWFRVIAKGGFDAGEKNWHYGMVHIGDPTLYADWNLNKGTP